MSYKLCHANYVIQGMAYTLILPFKHFNAPHYCTQNTQQHFPFSNNKCYKRENERKGIRAKLSMQTCRSKAIKGNRIDN